MKKICLVIAIIISVFAVGHEFWLMPQKFFYSVRETAIIRFRVGEDFTGENWKGNKEKVNQLLHFTPSGDTVDITSGISQNPGDSIRLPLSEEGTHMVVFQSTNSFISLEPEKFNAYLKEDGLEQAAWYRETHQEQAKTGKEHYQRNTKTLLQVSGTITNACTNPTGLPLDIIPLENPYSFVDLSTKEAAVKVRFRVLFKNHPLGNALVKTWYTEKGKGTQMDTLRTNKRGLVTANRHPGIYMISCVHMEHMSGDQEADWQSYWGSLSFEYPQYFRMQKSR